MGKQILYVTTYDPKDLNQYSGTGAFLFRSLQNIDDSVESLGPLRSHAMFRARCRQMYWQFLRGKRYLVDRNPGLLKGYADQIDAAVASSNPAAVVSPGGLPLAYSTSQVPKVIWADATFRIMRDYYETFSDLSPATIQEGEEAERRVLDSVSLAVFSSNWAAESALRDYGLTEDRVAVLSYGANMKELPDQERVQAAIANRPKNLLRLLFLGKAWERKGGDLAFELAQRLIDAGISVELVLAGCNPPPNVLRASFVRSMGFLRKTVPAELERLTELLLSSHYLVLPTQADATPIVFSEAAAHGLPALSTNTGGVPDIVRNGENGFIFDRENFVPHAFARVRENHSMPSVYEDLCKTSLKAAQERLSWRVSTEKLMRLIRDRIIQ